MMKPLFPGRRFSFLRLFIAILCIALVAAGTWSWITSTRTAAKKLPEPWFGGYVDVTATPSYEFESKVGNVYRNVSLGFITAGDGCQPSWGGYYTLDEAASALDLDSRIAQTYKTDRTVTVSFGGQNGTELASACSDVDSLADAYQQVINRYHITSLDFDIENKNLDGYSETATRRAQAVAKLIANEKAKAADSRALKAYTAKIADKVRGNIILPPGVSGDPVALFYVDQLPDGSVIEVRLKRSTGNAQLDAAIERAIQKSSPLPKPDRSELFQRTLNFEFYPLRD